ncbi:MAG: hypothetical protein ACYC5X_06710 [Syntrophales bacterium]
MIMCLPSSFLPHYPHVTEDDGIFAFPILKETPKLAAAHPRFGKHIVFAVFLENPGLRVFEEGPLQNHAGIGWESSFSFWIAAAGVRAKISLPPPDIEKRTTEKPLPSYIIGIIPYSPHLSRLQSGSYYVNKFLSQ